MEIAVAKFNEMMNDNITLEVVVFGPLSFVRLMVVYPMF
jgi:hypothetical protein